MESESSGVPEPNPTSSQPVEPTVTRPTTIASPITKVFTPQTGATVLKQMDAMLPQRKLTIIPASQARPLLSSNNLPPGTKTVLVRAITPGSPSTGTIPKVPPGSRFILVQPRTQNGVRPPGNLIRVPASTSLTAVTPKTFYATQKAPSAAASAIRPAAASVPPRTSTPITVRMVAPARTPAPAPAPQPATPKHWGYRKNKDMQDVARLNPDLQEAYMILLDMLADKNNNWPFMNQVDPVLDSAPDYNHVITNPVWLTKIKDKFLDNQYTKIIEPMNDLRLMFENCYRYNGPAHPVTKRALKLEHLMEQKIARLPPNLNEECAIGKFMETRPAVTETEAETDLRRSKRMGAGDYFSPILHRVRDEREKREEDIRLKIVEAKRLLKEEHEQRVKEWEEQLVSESAKRQIKTMWEIPQIAHFLALAQNVLNIDDVPLFEFELMFAMPQASLLLTTLMTNLLSSPQARLNMDKSQPKDYEFWHRKLSKRMTEWYRCYRKERCDPIKVLDVLGIEPPFWDIVGFANPLDQKHFHELTLHQRVWIFKTVCDIILHTDKGIQEVLSDDTGFDAMEVYLGVDRHDFHYFHLPAIAGDDVRVYRQKGFDLRKDPYWGPICDQREQEELERLRIEEEEKQRKEAEEEVKKKAKATEMTKGSKGGKGKRRSTREVKKKTAAPEPKRETRQRSLGTRISPRTLERSGIAIAESSDDESSLDAESKEEKSSKDDENESQLDEKLPLKSGKKKAAKKGKQKMKEEEEVEKIPKEDDKDVERTLKEDKKGIEDTSTEKDKEIKEEKEDSELKPEIEEEKVKEEREEAEDVKQENESEDVKEEKQEKEREDIKEEKEEKSTPSGLEEIKDDVKTEEEATTTPVSDIPRDPYEFELVIDSIGALKEWIASLGGEGAEESPVTNEVPEGENSEDKEKKAKKSIVKPVPCEIKLRKQLEALLEEKQPFAAQQLRIHEKIMKKLWQEYDSHVNGTKKRKESVDDGVDIDTAVTYEHTLLEQLGSDNEGVGSEGDGRYPKRSARKRKIFEPETSPSTKHAKAASESEPVPEGPPRLLTEGGITTRKSAADVKRYFAAIESRAEKSHPKTREPPVRKVKGEEPMVKSAISPAPAPKPAAPVAYEEEDELSFDVYENSVENEQEKRQPVPKRGLEAESESSEGDLEGNGTLSYEDDSEDEDWGVRKRKDDRRKKAKLRETEEELKQQLQALKRQQTMLSRAGQDPVTKVVYSKPPTTPVRVTNTVVTTPVVKERTQPPNAAATAGGAVDVKNKPGTETKSVSFDINAVVQQAASSGLLPQGVVTPLQIRVDEFVLTVQVQMGLDGPQILSYTAQ